MSRLRHDVRVDVTEVVGSGEPLTVAATVVLAEDAVDRPPSTVFVGYPGGGYNRHYFDIRITPDDRGNAYSQAGQHVDAGAIFVSCDHLGVGDSDVPVRPLDYDALARANARAAEEIVARLRDGSLAANLPALDVRVVVGMGQSFGGFLLTLAQAARAPFDAVAFLGWSAIRTNPGWPAGTDVESLVRNGSRGDDPENPRRRVYHWPDVAEEIVAADLTRFPGEAGSREMWGAASHPGGPAIVRDRNPVGAGVVAVEAAAISSPVFIGMGEIDVAEDPWSEPAAYRGSRDVTLCVFERMGHMHNFATTRTQLWNRLSTWAEGIRRDT